MGYLITGINEDIDEEIYHEDIATCDACGSDVEIRYKKNYVDVGEYYYNQEIDDEFLDYLKEKHIEVMCLDCYKEQKELFDDQR